MDENLQLIKSFVHPHEPHQPEFGFMLSNHLTKNVNFRPHNCAPYFFNFFLGFTFMLPETSLHADLSIQRSYWKLMPDNVGIKFVFFLNINGKLSMQVRNVFVKDDYAKWQRGITNGEYQALRDRLSLRVGNIDDYEKNLVEYTVKDVNMYQDELRPGLRKKMPVIVQKLHTDSRIIFTEPTDIRETGFQPLQQQTSSYTFNRATGFANKPLDQRIDEMKMAPTDRYLSSVKSVLGVIVEIYQHSKTSSQIPYEVWNGADCGFMHGAIMALENKVNFVPFVQHHMLPGRNDDANGLIGRFYMSLRHNLNPDPAILDTLNSRMPIAISFIQDISEERREKAKKFDWFILRRASLHDANWSEQVMLVQLNYKQGQTKAVASLGRAIQRKEMLNSMAQLYDQVMVKKTSDGPQKFVDYVNSIMDMIRYTGVTYDVKDTNYVSRYFLSMLAAINHWQEHDLETSIMNSENPDETLFLIKSKSDKIKIIIKIIESPMPEKKKIYEIGAPIEQTLGEPIFEHPEPFGDTIIFTVRQHYQHGKGNFITNENLEDFINREVSIGYGHYEKILNPDGLNLIEPFRIENSLLMTILDNEYEEFGEDMESFFKEYSPYIQKKSHFKAFIEGLFHSAKHARKLVPLRSFYSTNQMAIGFQHETNEIQRRGSGLAVVNFIYTQDLEGEHTHRATTALSLIRQRLRGASNRLFNIIYNRANTKAVVNFDDYSRAVELNCLRRRRSVPVCMTTQKSKTMEETEAFHKIPKTKLAIQRLGKIAGNIMAGVMLRDFISDLIRGDKMAALKDVAFIGGTMLSGKLASSAEYYAEKLLANGKFIAGNGLRAAAPILRRVTSLYVLNHLIDSINEYQDDKNNTAALVNIGTDSTFLAIDAVETGIEVLELFGVIEGVSSVTGPIGMAIGAVLIIGANIYETVKRMEALNNEIKLTASEEIEETVRAFLHLDVEEDVQVSIQGHKANQIIMTKVEQFLQKQKQVKYYITESGVLGEKGSLTMNENNIIDFRQERTFEASRANPTCGNKNFQIFCKLAKNSDDHVSHVDHHQSTWQSIKTSVNNFVWGIKMWYHLLTNDSNELINDVIHGEGGNVEHSYACYQSFGVESTVSKAELAFFQLGLGFDKVFGFTDKPNVFNFSNGHKILHGGNKDDYFMINGDGVEGAVVGYSGSNKVDFSRYHLNGILMINGSMAYAGENSNHAILLADINSVTGRPQQVDIISTTCNFIRIESLGGKSSQALDKIQIANDDNCTSSYNSTLILASFTEVQNHAESGQFVYIVLPESRSIKIKINGTNTTSHQVQIQNTITSFGSINSPWDNSTSRNVIQIGEEIIDIEVFGPEDNIQLQFSDGALLTSKTGHILVQLNTNFTIAEIIETYDTFLRDSGLSMIAFSISDQKSITFNHGRYSMNDETNSSISLNVVHNDPLHDSHIVCKNGKNLVLIKKNITGDLAQFLIPTISVDCTRSPLAELVLDFSSIAHQISELWPDYDLVIVPNDIHSSEKNVDLSIALGNVTTLKINRVIGKVFIPNSAKSEFYKQIQIITSGTPQSIKAKVVHESEKVHYYQTDAMAVVANDDTIRSKINYQSQYKPDPLLLGYERYEVVLSNNFILYLQAEPLVFTKTDSNIVYLTNYDVHADQEIKIHKEIDGYNFYRQNDTLIISNIDDKMFWDTDNSFSIILENYFARPKLATLTITFASGDRISFVDQMNELPNCQRLDSLWERVMTNDDYFYQH